MAILLDIQMPLKTGVEVVQELKAHYKELQKSYPNLKEPNYVFLSALIGQEESME